jgi:hypothetical protein
MSPLSPPRPPTAECRTVLVDGRVATVTATRRPRANRAEVKCVVPNAPQLSETMQTIVRLARLTEARLDSRDQVVLSMDLAPGADERLWELAAVLADRAVRGAWLPDSMPVVAMGWSDSWHLGQVSGGAAATVLAAAAQEAGHFSAADNLLLGGEAPAGQVVDAQYLTHLGALTGHADPAAAISSARAWFPLHSGGINDSLAWVEVSVTPLDTPAEDEEHSIAAPGLDLAAQQAVRQVLAAARHFDGKALGRWKTVVRFAQPRFQGESYQLALVMADRLARGREFVPRGRLIATGSSTAWHAGRVEAVAGRQPKTELILKQAAPGDRVLLPLAWQDELGAEYRPALRAKGASLACVERIGLI